MTHSLNTFGLEWTPELDEFLSKNLHTFSAVEIIPENFLEGRFSNFLDLLRETQIPVSVHGVSLSIGSADTLKTAHLREVLKLIQGLNVHSYSEHLSMTEIGGIQFDALTPLAWTKSQLDLVCDRISEIQGYLSTPFLIENVANRFVIPRADFKEVDFINSVIRRTGCGLLLDVTNVFTNSLNFKFNPETWLDSVDLSAVRAIHLAGGFTDTDGFLMDSHDNRISDEVWGLYSKVMARSTGVMTIIERTGNLPDYAELIGELDQAAVISGARNIQTRPGSPVEANL
ncbi:DUF692 domain-containing protein [bacterium]|nr:DUF692 domain-containing protein [bacterium]